MIVHPSPEGVCGGEEGLLIPLYLPMKHCLIIGCQHILFAQRTDYFPAIILGHHRELRNSSTIRSNNSKLACQSAWNSSRPAFFRLSALATICWMDSLRFLFVLLGVLVMVCPSHLKISRIECHHTPALSNLRSNQRTHLRDLSRTFHDSLNIRVNSFWKSGP